MASLLSLPARAASAEELNAAEAARQMAQAVGLARDSVQQGSPLLHETALPIKAERTIEFSTDEGTWMSLDVSPDGTTIVFTLLGDLYTLPIGGGEARQLTNGLALDEQPMFSPDGRRIVFESDRSGTRNLWTMKADGTELRRITSETAMRWMNPQAWSADGNSLLVRGQKTDGEIFQLFMIDIKTGAMSKLPTGEGAATAGAFTEGGKEIIFSLQGPAFDKDDLFRLDLRTQQRTPLGLAQKGGNSPLVSPDGRWLVYVVRNDPSDPSARDDSLQLHLHALNAKVPSNDRLLAVVRGGLNYRGAGQRYAFTPDSRSLIVTDEGKFKRIDLKTGQATAIPFTAAVKAELGTLRVNNRRLTDGPLQARAIMDVSVSPDGTRFAFSAVGKAWVMDAGGVPRRLTPGALDDGVREYEPVFSPDGRWIAYVSWSDTEGGKLWKVPLEGTGAQAAVLAGDSAQGPMAYASPCWTPDSRRVAFITASAKDWFESRFKSGRPGFGVWWQVSTPQRMGWVNVGGGQVHLLPAVQGDNGPAEPNIHPTISVSGDGARVFFTLKTWDRFGVHPLQSIGLDAKDRSDVQTHARLRLYEDELRVRPSPDGRWLAVQSKFNVQLVPLSRGSGSTGEIPEIVDEVGYVFGVKPTADIIDITTDGGRFPTWSPDGQWLNWSASNRIFRLPLREALSKQRPLRPQSTAIELSVPRLFGEGRLLLRNARVVTMRASGIVTTNTAQGPHVATDPGVIERADILVEGRRIAAVGPAGSLTVPAGTKVMDVSGKTIIPGIIGLDDEPAGISPMLRDLWPQYAVGIRYGVMTISNHGTDEYPRDELLDTGQLVGPRIFGALRVLHPEWMWMTSLEDARQIARTDKAMGGTRLSLYHPDHRIQRQWLTLAATAEGIDAGHEPIINFADHIGGVLDGNASTEHFEHYVQDGYRDVLQLYARSGTTFISTLTQGIVDDFKPDHTYTQWQLASKYEELVLRGAASGTTYARFKLRPARAARDVLRSGGNIALGSHGHPGFQTLAEIVRLSAGGMSRAEALRCATLNGARGLGLEQDLGSIEAGKIADLVVLNGNPLEDLRHLSDVVYTAKDGVLYDASTLDTLWPTPRTFPRQPWQDK